MKKILIFLLAFLSFISVKASENDSNVEIKWIPNVYYNYEKGGVIYWGQLGYIYANDKIAYCIDISMNITSSVYSSNLNINVVNRLPEVIFFGYGYKENNTKEYYMATQKLIWKLMGANVYYTTNSGGTGNTIDVSAMENEIMKSVNNYGVFPKFDGLFKFDLGSTNTIIDKSNVLNNFMLTNNSNNNITIDNNSLIIKANEKGDYTFKLTTNYGSRFENKVFTANNSQKLIQIGYINNVFKTYSYKINSGSLNINLYDNITKSVLSSGSATLKGNIFKLYDSNHELINTYETMEDGKIYIDNLNLGKYTLEHFLTSEGYKRDKSIYEFEIEENNISKNIDIYLNLITTTLNIRKTYGNPKVGTIYYDEGVVFDITNDSGKVIECITNNIGECSIELIYDNYLVTQKNTDEGNNYIININNFNKIHNYDIYTPVYNAKIKVYLYESGTTIPISNMKFNLDQEEYITNEEGFFITRGVNIGDYVLKELQNNKYYKMDDVTIKVDEDSNYYIENNDVYIDITIYNEKIITVEDIIIDEDVKNNTNYEEDFKELSNITISNLTNNIDANNNFKEKIIIEDNITKLPNLGINNTNILYMILFVLKIKNVKKNNM